MTGNGGKRSVLAIDDDMTVLAAIRNMLSANYAVTLANSADMAITVLKNSKVDLILLDVEMPGMSGLTFMGYLRSQRNYYYIPVIFVTSHGTPDIILQAAKSGAKDFIVKPIIPKILMDKCLAVLKVVQEPLSREGWIRKLHMLENAAGQGQSLRIEQLSEELTHYRYSLEMDGKIAEVRKAALQLDYSGVAEKTAGALEILRAETAEEDADPSTDIL